MQPVERRTLSLLLVAVIASLAAACNRSSPVTAATGSSVSTVVASTLSGKVRGGQQPVTGSTIQLYQVGTSGDGSAASTLGTATTTDANGNFTLTNLYTCPGSNPQVYLLASGGNPGLTSGTNNTAIDLIVALGSCTGLSSSTYIYVDEVTTVAAVAALTSYMTSPTSIGSGTSDAAALATAFTLAAEYANNATGYSPGLSVPTADTVPTTLIYTLADIVATCVNSGGGKAGDGTSCGNLFTDATPSGGSAPTNVANALLDIFNNPTNGLSSLFGLVSASPPFQPTLNLAPSSWTVSLTTSTASTWTGGGDGVWRRNANTIYGEAYTFDPCNAHQPGSGEYHYHENPVCLRYEAGDNVTGTNVGTASATYAETTGTHTHSPILGWAWDGYPVYGPYGYSTADDSGSGVRRMVSSYALRTDNTTTRTSLPAWAQTYQGIGTLTSSQYGPPVSTTYPLGRYVEDYAYTLGSGDLDQYNGRYCVTPDFPNGTYAYFVTIDASGNAAFPYYLGPQFFGTVSGGNVTSVTETTSTYYSNHAYQSGSSILPQVISWLLTYTSQYAKIINGSDVAAGAVDTWTGNTTPTYADIQEIRFSSDYVYLNISGLASHIMGPWYLNQAKTQVFPNLPTNQNTYSRIPLTPTVASNKTATGGGSQGRWINGVSMFNMLDFYSWSYSKQEDVGPGM